MDDRRVLRARSCALRTVSSAGKHRRIQIREEGRMQPPDYAGHVFFFHDERQVNLRGTLRDHTDLQVGKLTKHPRRDAGRVAQTFANETYDRLATLVFYVRKFGQIRGQSRDRLVRVYCQRYADFGGGDYIHGDFVAVKGLEDRFQKSMRQEHAGRCDVHDGDAFFRGDGFEDVLTVRGPGRDFRSLTGRIARVEDKHGNVLLDGGQHGGGMQNFRAEISKFRRFIKADHADAMSIG